MTIQIDIFVSERVWSPYQLAVFDHMTGRGNARVDAVAGSGKTTTGVEAIKRVPPDLSTLFLAYNRRIADELKKRGILSASTFNSLGYRAINRHMAGRALEPRKLWKLQAGKSPRYVRLYAAWCRELVDLARNHGIGAISDARDEGEWLALIEHHGLPFRRIKRGNETFEPQAALELAMELLEACNEDRTRMDFNDQLYLPVRHEMALPTFDVIFIDEAQDTNPIQRELLKRALNPGGRLVAIGDPHQAIYGFRGADADAMDLISREFATKTLPLSICYRCGSSIVEYAQQWVPHIQTFEGAPAGSVDYLADTWDASLFKPADVVLCRVNAPLFGLAMQMLRLRVPVHILGRDIGAGIKRAIEQTDAQEVSEMLRRLYQATQEEAQEAIERDSPLKAAACHDRFQAVVALSEGCRSVTEVLALIEELFRDKAGAVQLSTVHKAKGFEWDTVHWLRPELPWLERLNVWQLQQEDNLQYVAATRAKKQLNILVPKA